MQIRDLHDEDSEIPGVTVRWGWTPASHSPLWSSLHLTTLTPASLFTLWSVQACLATSLPFPFPSSFDILPIR